MTDKQIGKLPLRIYPGSFSGNWYATNRYKLREGGGLEALSKEDVTTEIEKILDWATESLEDRIEVLERREALLMATVKATRAWFKARELMAKAGDDPDLNYEARAELRDADEWMSHADAALTEAGFPWAPEAGK